MELNQQSIEFRLSFGIANTNIVPTLPPGSFGVDEMIARQAGTWMDFREEITVVVTRTKLPAADVHFRIECSGAIVTDCSLQRSV
jgi:hypothetical protein